MCSVPQPPPQKLPALPGFGDSTGGSQGVWGAQTPHSCRLQQQRHSKWTESDVGVRQPGPGLRLRWPRDGVWTRITTLIILCLSWFAAPGPVWMGSGTRRPQDPPPAGPATLPALTAVPRTICHSAAGMLAALLMKAISPACPGTCGCPAAGIRHPTGKWRRSRHRRAIIVPSIQLWMKKGT